MRFEAERRLLEIVRADDVKGFGEIASPEVFSAVFGRFPILSLLYLFSARRIVKRHFDELIKERPRLRYDRIEEADALFVKKAGKALRHYHAKEVSPLEMLAILGRPSALKKLYAVYPAADRYLAALHEIYYTRLGEGVVRKGEALILPKEPMPYLQKKIFRVSSFILLALFALTLALTLSLSAYTGMGTTAHPYRVRNEKELTSVLKEGGTVSLEKDITLSSTGKEVSAEIIGGNHIIRLTAPFAEVFTGVLKDVTFVLEEGYPARAVIGKNQGKLENVSVVTQDLSYTKSAFEETLAEERTDENEESPDTAVFSLFATVNEGLILDSAAVVTLTFTGEEGGNSYFAAFVGENKGTVKGCSAQGKVTSLAVDMAGIVARNKAEGNITECGSSVEFTQRTTVSGWNPNVAGVVAENEGGVYRSVNAARITSEIALTSLGEGVYAAAAYAAGIACMNTGVIKDCKNEGEITALGAYGYAFAAGIVCRNEIAETENPALTEVGLYGNVSRGKIVAYSSTDEACAAGIAKDNFTNVVDCANYGEIESTASLSAPEEELSAACAGGVVGLNFGALTSSVNHAEVSAKGKNAYAYSGGITAINRTYDLYAGTVTSCSGLGKVTAVSASDSVYAGGIAARNDANNDISACRQIADVSASVTQREEGKKAYVYLGGIAGCSYGSIQKSFYTGAVTTGDENTFTGGICGAAHYVSYRLYPILFLQNAYISGEGKDHGAGALIVQDLFSGTNYIYGAATLEGTDMETNLDFQTVKVASLDEMKALEVYFE